MLGLIFSLGMRFGKWRASLDSALANMLSGIGRVDSDGVLHIQRYNDTWRFGGPVRKRILNPAYLISLTLRGMAWCCWRTRFVESGLMIDLLEMKLYDQWKVS